MQGTQLVILIYKHLPQMLEAVLQELHFNQALELKLIQETLMVQLMVKFGKDISLHQPLDYILLEVWLMINFLFT